MEQSSNWSVEGSVVQAWLALGFPLAAVGAVVLKYTVSGFPVGKYFIDIATGDLSLARQAMLWTGLIACVLSLYPPALRTIKDRRIVSATGQD